MPRDINTEKERELQLKTFHFNGETVLGDFVLLEDVVNLVKEERKRTLEEVSLTKEEIELIQSLMNMVVDATKGTRAFLKVWKGLETKLSKLKV